MKRETALRTRLIKGIIILFTVWLISVVCFECSLEIKAAPIQSLELTKENLCNPQNYKKGWYKSWGGSYEEGSGFCSAYFYQVTKPSYYIYINSSQIEITISEYDSNGRWVKHTDKLRNGSKFTPQSNTTYINLTVSSTKWGVDFLQLLENGLQIEFTDSDKVPKVEVNTVNIENANFSKVDNWNRGLFSYQTGEYVFDTNQIAFNAYCIVNSSQYVVRLPGGYLKMNIIEMDANGKVIANSDLHSGQKWKKKDNTEKIAISVYTNDKRTSFTYDEYKALIAGYSEFGLKPYISYYIKDKMDELSAEDFIEKMNVGWNLGNSFDSKSDKKSRGFDANLKQEMNWGNPYVTKDLIDYVASCGFNTIRIPVSWYYNTGVDENGKLHVGAQWLERVKEVVDYAIVNDMYVILNSHHDQPIFYAGTTDENMQKILADVNSLWTDVALYFKDYDEHLIFESFNEVDNIEKSWNYSDLSAEQMNLMNQTFIDTVRITGGNNEKRILMVPTLLDGTGTDILSAFRMPIDSAENRIVVQVHMYTKVFQQNIEPTYENLENFSMRIGAPLVIGECGTANSYPLPEFRSIQASNFVARAAAHGIKCIWWDNGSNYAIIDRRDYAKSNTTMIQALMDGANGIAYQTQGDIVLNQLTQFVLRMPNLKTGAIEEKYWGTLTTNYLGGSIPIPAGKKCLLYLKRRNEASDIWLQRVVFYDAAGNYISGKELQSTEYMAEVPKNASFMRVSMNSPTRSLTLEQYGVYLMQGDLELNISLFDMKDTVSMSVVKK